MVGGDRLTSCTLNPSDDSIVKQTTPDDNYGDDASLHVLTKTDANQRSFLKFSLAELPPEAVIAFAKLRLYCKNVYDLVAGVTDVQVRRVADDTWTEMGITWTNQPDYGDVEDTKAPSSGWIEWDVTAWVRNKFAGDGIVSICIKSVVEDYDGTNRWSNYSSRDEASNHPELYIVYNTPGVVGESKDDHATREPFQRQCFYASGRFWVFYSDRDYIFYKTSINGLTWTNAKVIRVNPHHKGVAFSIWFDGVFLHYAAEENTALPTASALYYRRGTPNVDGTITWSAEEQTVHTIYDSVWVPFVSVDADGYAWIGYGDFYDMYNGYPYVIKSGNNDGTWGETPAGFPKKLSTDGQTVWRVYPIPLTDNKMLVIYSHEEVPIKAICWNGTDWEDEVTTTSNARYGGPFSSAVAQGDNVHLVFLKSTTFDIIHVKYSYSTNSFGAETTVQAATTEDSAPVLSIDAATNNLYCFWAGSPAANHIYYKKYVGVTWDVDPTDWLDESVKVLLGNQVLSSFYKSYNDYIGLEYMTLTASPYYVNFDFLTMGVPPPPPKGTIAIHAKLVGII